MNSTRQQICRLCLKVTKNDHQVIDDTIKELFDILLLKLDLETTRDPIVCRACVDVAKKCLNFKSVCINTEEIILSFSAGMRKSKRCIKFIYAANKEHVPMVNDDDIDICRFCMSRLERNNCMLLNTLLNKPMFEMTTKYIPEMDFKIFEDPVICTTCIENLECHSQFVTNCLETETTIKTYCKEDKSVNKEHINLNSYLPFLFNDIVEYPVEYQIYIKQETNTTEDTEGIDPEAYNGIIKQEELCNKDEETNSCKNSGTYESNMICLKTGGHNIEGHTYQQMVQGNIVKDGFVFEAELEEKWHESSDSQDMAIDNYAEAVSGPNYKGNNNGDSISESKIHQRPLCAYDTKRNDCLKTHSMSIHNGVCEVEMFKCALCTYKTKNKYHLNRHMLVHKDPSEIEMFKCALCAHETKRKCHLETHMLVHKDASEIIMFKCALCAYETKRKRYLQKHMLVHKDISEIKMLKCALCTYEAKHKSYLRGHMLVHKDVSEIKMFKCASCTYETKRKIRLTEHMLVHKEVSELKMFKCALCAYEAKTKSYLEKHMLIHKDISEIEMFKCSFCSYVAKQKRYIDNHMLIHKNVSEIKMFKCALCTYETKRKCHLNGHLSVHKDVSKIEMFKCPLCAFQTKRRGNLNRHSLVHK